MQNLPEVKFLESIYDFSYINDGEQSPILTTSSSTLSLPSTNLSATPMDPFDINQDEDRASTPPSTTSDIENAIEPVDLKSNISCFECIKSSKGWRYAKNIGSVIVEMFETGSISYASWILYTYNPHNLSKISYVVVTAGAGTGLTMEILKINHCIKPEKYEAYEFIKIAFAGSAAAANFLQGFMKHNNTAVAVGLGALGLLTFTTSALHFYQKRDFFRTNIGKLIKYSADGAYYLLAGAGLCAYLFLMVNGFGKNPDALIVWGVTSVVAGSNLLANLIKKCNSNATKITFGLVLLVFLCAAPYGIDNALFAMLLMLDIVSDLLSSNLPDPIVYSILGISIAACLIVTLRRMCNDFDEPHHEHHEVDEHTPLHAVIANRGRVEELEVVEDHRKRGCIASELSSQWSNPLCFLRSRNEESGERCSWVKSLTNCLQPRSEPLLQEVRLHPIN